MDLKELLGEELYNQVIEKAGDNKIAVVSDGSYVPKEKFDSINNEKNEYKKQVGERDEQLKNLSSQVKDNQELKDEISRLQEENQIATQELQNKLDQQAFDFALDKALTGAKAKNAKAVKALLDTDKLKLDGEKILGLDEQLEAVKESDSYLFEQEQQQNDGKPNFLSGHHGSGGGFTKRIEEMSYQELADLKESDPDQFKQLTNNY